MQFLLFLYFSSWITRSCKLEGKWVNEKIWTWMCDFVQQRLWLDTWDHVLAIWCKGCLYICCWRWFQTEPTTLHKGKRLTSYHKHILYITKTTQPRIQQNLWAYFQSPLYRKDLYLTHTQNPNSYIYDKDQTNSELRWSTFSPPYASRTYMLLLVVVNSIDFPSLLNLISQTSAISPPTKKVSKGPYIWKNKLRFLHTYWTIEVRTFSVM